LLFALPGLAQDGAKGGATKLMTPLKTHQDVQAVQPGDLVAMSCPKCRSTYVTRVETPPKGSQPSTTAAERHECPGCGAKVETVGHGKAKTEKIVHVCRQCGSKAAFCCSVKKGDVPTPGMEK
jgi:ribosomal protein L37AE/L43A